MRRNSNMNQLRTSRHSVVGGKGYCAMLTTKDGRAKSEVEKAFFENIVVLK